MDFGINVHYIEYWSYQASIFLVIAYIQISQLVSKIKSLSSEIDYYMKPQLVFSKVFHVDYNILNKVYSKYESDRTITNQDKQD